MTKLVRRKPKSNCFNDLSGKRFGYLTVIKLKGFKGAQTYYECRCDCGNIKCVGGTNLVSGGTKSCGKCDYFKKLFVKRVPYGGRKYSFNGKRQSLSAWAKEFGVSYQAMWQRIRDYPVSVALNQKLWEK